MTSSFLSDLVSGQDDFTIRVRVYFFIHGNLMHGIIRKNQVYEFKDKLSEGSVFIIKNFKVNLFEDIVEIPMIDFQFINPDVIYSWVNNNTVLSDVVGCLYGIGDIESVGSKWKKRNIQIFTDYSNVNNLPIEEKMFLNLYGYNYFGWNYISCNVYNIHIKVTDRTGDSTFTIFNDVADKLIDISAHKLFNQLTSANNDVPVQVLSLSGKEFFFKLKLNKYNLKEGLENFTISKLWIPHDNLEVQYKLRKEEKGKNLSKNETEPKD
ncbi:hypothetical protein R3W88_011798 [Solanum pinnatisectum]|uniref:Replication factor A C-terminal domain-containing protein n=1 Tax=Solanum pinnatisectum TaxID=50273 RepID=A0AAV9LAT9_9SOLN|nr:hypothetical protein R3W88_011798 [Solanum pinnatisectum]